MANPTCPPRPRVGPAVRLSRGPVRLAATTRSRACPCETKASAAISDPAATARKVVVEMAPELGLDPAWAAVWFGVLFVMNIQIYFLSPPFGPACFWLKSVAPPDITLQEIFAAVLPFIALQIIGLLIVMFVPDVALYLPKLLNG